jgi:hypothetical protein
MKPCGSHQVSENRSTPARMPGGGVSVAGHALRAGGASFLRGVMTGAARAGRGVRCEAESEGSRSPKRGPDEQKSDLRPTAWGIPARDAGARWSSRHAGGGSGGARGQDATLKLERLLDRVNQGILMARRARRVVGGRRARAAERDQVPGRQAQAACQPAEECDGLPPGTQVPGPSAATEGRKNLASRTQRVFRSRQDPSSLRPSGRRATAPGPSRRDNSPPVPCARTKPIFKAIG